jgi:hypothetical protein
MIKEFPMKISDHYIVVEKMIRQGKVAFAELADLLDTLEAQERITAEEHRALIALAEHLNTGSPAPH